MLEANSLYFFKFGSSGRDGGFDGLALAFGGIVFPPSSNLPRCYDDAKVECSRKVLKQAILDAPLQKCRVLFCLYFQRRLVKR